MKIKAFKAKKSRALFLSFGTNILTNDKTAETYLGYSLMLNPEFGQTLPKFFENIRRLAIIQKQQSMIFYRNFETKTEPQRLEFYSNDVSIDF